MQPVSQPKDAPFALDDDQQEDEATDPSPKQAAVQPQSRIDRIRAKIARLRGKNPDIYPMW